MSLDARPHCSYHGCRVRHVADVLKRVEGHGHALVVADLFDQIENGIKSRRSELRSGSERHTGLPRRGVEFDRWPKMRGSASDLLQPRFPRSHRRDSPQQTDGNIFHALDGPELCIEQP